MLCSLQSRFLCVNLLMSEKKIVLYYKTSNFVRFFCKLLNLQKCPSNQLPSRPKKPQNKNKQTSKMDPLPNESSYQQPLQSY